MNLLELFHDFISWLNDFWVGENTIIFFDMTEKEKILFEKELAYLVSKDLILKKDMEIMIENGEEIRKAIEELFNIREDNYIERKEFFRKLIILLKSYGLSSKYINYAIKGLAPLID